MARLGSSVLTLFSLAFASFGFWRVATDLGWAGDFVFEDGLLSHSQVWLCAAAAAQYAAWRLGRYARGEAEVTPKPVASVESPEPLKAVADVHA